VSRTRSFVWPCLRREIDYAFAVVKPPDEFAHAGRWQVNCSQLNGSSLRAYCCFGGLRDPMLERTT